MRALGGARVAAPLGRRPRRRGARPLRVRAASPRDHARRPARRLRRRAVRGEPPTDSVPRPTVLAVMAVDRRGTRQRRRQAAAPSPSLDRHVKALAVLAILQFDAASVSVLDRLLAEGRLPDRRRRCASVACGTTSTRPATQFAAGAQHTLYSGVELADHGLFYPFQWSPAEQRVRYMNDVRRAAAGLGAARAPRHPHARGRPVREPTARRAAPGHAGVRMAAARPRRAAAVVVAPAPRTSGSSASSARPSPSTRCSVATTSTRCSACAAACSARRAASPTRPRCSWARRPFDLAWLTFCAAHVAGHQFWDLSQLDADGLDDRRDARARHHPRRRLRRRSTPRIGRVSTRCPSGADVMVVSPVGMDVNTSRADMLPEMLRAILDPRASRRQRPARRLHLAAARRAPDRPAARRSHGCSRSASRSTSPRASSCAASTGAARARSRTRPRTRATCGSTCEGASATASSTPPTPTRSCDEIADGVAHVPRSRRRARRRVGRARRRPVRPRAPRRPAPRPHRALDRPPGDELRGRALRAFGTVQRHGVGSGRSGNHTEGDAWALVVPGASRPSRRSRPPRLEDVAATAAALAGVDLERPGRRAAARLRAEPRPAGAAVGQAPPRARPARRARTGRVTTSASRPCGPARTRAGPAPA